MEQRSGNRIRQKKERATRPLPDAYAVCCFLQPSMMETRCSAARRTADTAAAPSAMPLPDVPPAPAAADTGGLWLGADGGKEEDCNDDCGCGDGGRDNAGQPLAGGCSARPSCSCTFRRAYRCMAMPARRKSSSSLIRLSDM